MSAADDFLVSGPCDRVELVEGLGRALVADGLPLHRLWLGGMAVHPLYAAVGAVWTPDDGVAPVLLPFALRGTLRPQNTLHGAVETVVNLRLTELPPGTMGLPHSLWEDGYVDLAYVLVQERGRPMGFMTLATRSGFGQHDIDRLQRLVPLLKLALRLIDREQLLEVLASTYLGAQTGRRVLDGQIHRGDAEHIRAAIWFSDLRGFSELGQTLPTSGLLALLDDAFEVQVGCIQEHGGEVLKFIGDGLLAVFRDADERRACAAALEAGIALRGQITARNDRRSLAGDVPIRYGLSLHHGEVVYGNIGAPDRLDFTVVGPAVNLAARVEGLCGPLGHDLLASEAFARRCPGEFTSLGRFPLKGVGEVEVLAPAMSR